MDSQFTINKCWLCMQNNLSKDKICHVCEATALNSRSKLDDFLNWTISSSPVVLSSNWRITTLAQFNAMYGMAIRVSDRGSIDRVLIARDFDNVRSISWRSVGGTTRRSWDEMTTADWAALSVVLGGVEGSQAFIDGLQATATSSISPPFIIHSLFRSKHIVRNAKILLVSSESGSITLRHSKEEGGNYAHHASKSALNMVGKLLSLDLKDG